MKITNALSAAALNAIKATLDGGRMYYFAGPVPAEAGDALDMVNDHTEVVVMTESGDGTTGLTFETSSGGSLSKNSAEEWSGVVTFSGAEDTETTLTPTFFRFCPAGDDGRGAGSGGRIQGTIGGPSSPAEIKLSDGTTVTDNGANTRSLAIFNINLSSLG